MAHFSHLNGPSKVPGSKLLTFSNFYRSQAHHNLPESITISPLHRALDGGRRSEENHYPALRSRWLPFAPVTIPAASRILTQIRSKYDIFRYRTSASARTDPYGGAGIATAAVGEHRAKLGGQRGEMFLDRPLRRCKTTIRVGFRGAKADSSGNLLFCTALTSTTQWFLGLFVQYYAGRLRQLAATSR